MHLEANNLEAAMEAAKRAEDHVREIYRLRPWMQDSWGKS